MDKQVLLEKRGHRVCITWEGCCLRARQSLPIVPTALMHFCKMLWLVLNMEALRGQNEQECHARFLLAFPISLFYFVL